MANIRKDAEQEITGEELLPGTDKTDAEAAPAPVNPGDEPVSIHLFKDNDRYKGDVFVAVNGESVQIRRGETVQVKRKFADVIEQSMKQDAATANLIEQESADFAARARALNI